MDLTIYFEVFVSILILLGDIFRDDIVGNVAGTAAEIASAPTGGGPRTASSDAEHSASKWCAVLPFNHGIQPANRHLRR